MDHEKLKYPIGKFTFPENISDEDIKMGINIIDKFPTRLQSLVKDLSDEQLDTRYRSDGWTIRQVIHHCADSHINSIARFKWTLTEDLPTIKPYFEDRWGELFDSKEAPVDLSLNLLKSLHTKWVYLLRGLTPDDLKLKYYNPESKKEISLRTNIMLYSWHCEHHYAHIANLIKEKGW